MELFDYVASTIDDTKLSLMGGFLPELVICVTIFALLILRLFNAGKLLPPFLVTLVGSLVALYFAFPIRYLLEGEIIERHELFTGMLVFDNFAVYVRSLLLVFAVLFAIFTWLSGVPDKSDAADFYCLVLGATLGMCLMVTANHLLIVFMSIEMASVPSYALAAMLKGRREASEAALKYSIYGAGAAGIMLYGISLLAGLLGTCHLPTMGTQLALMMPDMAGSEKMVLTLATLMVGVGLAFKLSAVPFHFWCPDVFDGASSEVDAFLSIASKAAALALVVRLTIGTAMPHEQPPVPVTEIAAASAQESGLMSIADEPVKEASESADPLKPVRHFLALLWAFVAAITCTFGNLAAYGQTNIKRLLAYSTIAHAGYMLFTIPTALMLYGQDNAAASRAIGALSIYMAIYLFMNLGAFAIVAFLRNTLYSERIEDYAGIIRRHPTVVICMAIVMFSLVGIPPLAGFVGKFAIFASLAEGYNITGNACLMALLVIGGLNTVLSLFYYLRVVKVMAIEPESSTPSSPWSMVSLSGAFLILVTVPLLLLFVYWQGLEEWTTAATSTLF